MYNNSLFRNSQLSTEIDGQNHLAKGNKIWASIQYHPNWTNPPSSVDADEIKFFGSDHIFTKITFTTSARMTLKVSIRILMPFKPLTTAQLAITLSLSRTSSTFIV
jgi:hypothetical protein